MAPNHPTHLNGPQSPLTPTPLLQDESDAEFLSRAIETATEVEAQMEGAEIREAVESMGDDVDVLVKVGTGDQCLAAGVH
jgi:hypothetical protein